MSSSHELWLINRVQYLENEIENMSRALKAMRFDLEDARNQRDAARSEAQRLKLTIDNPEFDATDGAHPAWWRAHDYVYERLKQSYESMVQREGVTAAALQDLADDKENVQCLVARLGEGTLECRHDRKCNACIVAERIAKLERELKIAKQTVKQPESGMCDDCGGMMPYKNGYCNHCADKDSCY